MGQDENSGILKAPIAAFKKQNSLSEELDYFDGVTGKMKLNTLYSGIVAKITAAQGKITDCRNAVVKALSGNTGDTKAKNLAEYLMKNDMKSMLHEIQLVGNADIPNAYINYDAVDVTFRTRKSSEKEDIEIFHGEISGTFELQIRPPEGTYSVVWFVTTTPDDAKSWVMADFNHNSHGFLEGCKPGVDYYFKSKHKSTVTGASDWTQIVKIMCL